ncbi:hypothetical protein AVEN_222240-1 [Araneus ventricosus]|uniref:Uncharacterized protein n=1 Tax=Araneus ventricosus TaxID=182803 RepID=A0A4Y2JYP1_ARAVE|nr:hypothetical protein AVEN_222240-1 [Araneus ventricosus]
MELLNHFHDHGMPENYIESAWVGSHLGANVFEVLSLCGNEIVKRQADWVKTAGQKPGGNAFRIDSHQMWLTNEPQLTSGVPSGMFEELAVQFLRRCQ